jgi:hypothetical protein
VRRRQLCRRLFGRTRGGFCFPAFPIEIHALTCGNQARHDETSIDKARHRPLAVMNMPAHPRPLAATDGPLARFALELRRLRDQAPADRPTSIDKVVREANNRVTRAAIYSALSGRTLPSRGTLTVMVSAWSPIGVADLGIWNERRSQCERDLSLRRESSPPTAAGSGSSDAAAHHTSTQVQPALGAELRKLRQHAGMSLGELAGLVHYSKGYLSKVETGHAQLNHDLAARADAALDLGGALSKMLPPRTMRSRPVGGT